jgi:hypothetical protein
VPLAGVPVAVPVPPCGVTDEVAGCPDGGICALEFPEVVVAVPVPVPTEPGFVPANAGATITNTVATTASVRTIIIGSPFGMWDADVITYRNADAKAGTTRRRLFTSPETVIVPSVHETESAIRRSRDSEYGSSASHVTPRGNRETEQEFAAGQRGRIRSKSPRSGLDSGDPPSLCCSQTAPRRCAVRRLKIDRFERF